MFLWRDRSPPDFPRAFCEGNGFHSADCYLSSEASLISEAASEVGAPASEISRRHGHLGTSEAPGPPESEWESESESESELESESECESESESESESEFEFEFEFEFESESESEA